MIPLGKRLLRVASIFFALILLFAGTLHLPSVQRSVVSWVSNWASESSGLKVELNAIHIKWWKGQIEAQGIKIFDRNDEVLAEVSRFGMGAMVKVEGVWSVQNLSIEGSTIFVERWLRWSEADSGTSSSAWPAFQVDGIEFTRMVLMLPDALAGGQAEVNFSDVHASSIESGFNFKLGQGAVQWNTGKTTTWSRPEGKLDLSGVQIKSHDGGLEFAVNSIQGLGWVVAAEGLLDLEQEIPLRASRLNWSYSPERSDHWWGDVEGIEVGQQYWGSYPFHGAWTSVGAVLALNDLQFASILELSQPVTVKWLGNDFSAFPAIEGGIRLNLDSMRSYEPFATDLDALGIPWMQVQNWLGHEIQLEGTWDPKSEGELAVRSATGKTHLQGQLNAALDQLRFTLTGFEPSRMGWPGPKALNLTAELTSHSPLHELDNWDWELDVTHSDLSWAPNRIEATGNWEPASQKLQARISSSSPGWPVNVSLDAHLEASDWSIKWTGDLQGLTPLPSQDMQVFATLTGVASGQSNGPIKGQCSVRNVILLDEKRPTTFERFDAFTTVTSDRAEVKWESDLGVGNVSFDTDLNTWKNWFENLRLRTETEEAPELRAEIQFRRTGPIAALTRLPWRLADGTRIEAQTNSEGLVFNASSSEAQWDKWVAEDLEIHAAGWSGELFANMTAHALRNGGDAFAAQFALDLHADTVWAADAEWIGWGNTPTRLTLQAQQFEHQWNIDVYEASVPWLENRLELAEVPARIEWNRDQESTWEFQHLHWETLGAALDISGSIGARIDAGLIVEGSIQSLPPWSGFEEMPLGLDSAHWVIEGCNLLDVPMISSEGFFHGMRWGETSVEAIEWSADSDLSGLSMWWEAGTKGQPVIAGNGRIPLAAGQEINLNILADGLPLAWLNPLLPSETVELNGNVNGWMRWTGDFQAPELNGQISVNQASAYVNYLGVGFTLDGEADVRPDHIALDSWAVRDDQGNPAVLTGTIVHQGLKDWNFDLSLDASQTPIHLMELSRTQNDLFYGKAYANGDANVSGYANNLVVEARLKTAPGTQFALPLDAASDARYADFITFTAPSDEDEKVEIRDLSRIRMDLALDITEDAEARIIFDESVGDEITGTTRGALNLTIDDFERFAMTGQLEVLEGGYLFTLQQLINKQFTVIPGGTVTWFGDPYAAEIDLGARYEIRAGLEPLLPMETNLPGRSKVQLNMGLEGNLMRPEIAFSVEVPEVDSRLQALVESALINEEELNRQVMGLLVLQQFLSPDATAAIGTTGIQDRSTEFLASQIGFWISQLTREVNVGIDYGTNATSGEQALAVALSAQLLDDRLHVEGAVGTNHLFSGSTDDLQLQDVRIRYDLPPDGTFQVTGYTTTNPAITGQSGSSTQGVGVLMQSEFNSLGELWDRILGKADENR